MSFELHLGDCVEVMGRWPQESVDAICTDPPYGLRFMAKSWDFIGKDVFEQITWNYRWAVQAYRVMKPGAYALVFNHSRTVHYLMVALEAAGFEIRDTIDWLYFNGFPKSKNSDDQGTALKPAKEPIVFVQKPREGTYQENVEQYGVGMLNIDACRIKVSDSKYAQNFSNAQPGRSGVTNWQTSRGTDPSSVGRWPSNIIIDELVAYEMDLRCGLSGANGRVSGNEPSAASEGLVTNKRKRVKGAFHGDKGGPSRYFYCPKPTRAEREYGCEGLPLQTAGEMTDREDDSDGLKSPRAGAGRTGGARNFHPTLKPINLMRYLCRLIAPAEGVVVDPFMGSGTTGIAALLEGYQFVGVEQELKYMGIAAARVSTAASERNGHEATEDEAVERTGSHSVGEPPSESSAPDAGAGERYESAAAAASSAAPVQQTGG